MFLFDKELVRIRKERGFSQEYLGKQIEMSRSYICKLETGERLPNYDLVVKIADACNLDRYDLNKLLIFAELPPELNSSSESYKICLKLVLEFKEKGLFEEAKSLIETGMKIFDNTVEISALFANLHLMEKDYKKAIQINENALDIFSQKMNQNSGISKAELIYNLAYVYFERGVETKTKAERLVIEETERKSQEYYSDTDYIIRMKIIKSHKEAERLTRECINDLNKAIKGFESAYALEPEKEHMLEQLAVSYLNMASAETGEKKSLWLKKSVEMYDNFLEVPNVSEPLKKINSSIFLAMSLAKLYDLEESIRLINVVISCKPDYFLGYYGKGCIYSINGHDNTKNLKISLDNLQKAIEKNPSVREEIRWDIDLLNLRVSNLFKEKFKKLYDNEII